MYKHFSCAVVKLFIVQSNLILIYVHFIDYFNLKSIYVSVGVSVFVLTET